MDHRFHTFEETIAAAAFKCVEGKTNNREMFLERCDVASWEVIPVR